MRCFLAIFVCLLPGAPPARAASFELEAIHITGLRRLPEAKVIAALGLRVGQQVDKPDFDAAQQRLIDRGVFASVGYSYKPGPNLRGFAVTYEVAEIETVFSWKFEELPGPESALEKLLRQDPLFADKLPATENVLKHYAHMLSEHLKIPVIGRVYGDRPGDPYIVFRPNRPRAVIAQVAFAGNSAVPVADLQIKMASIAVGTPYIEENFREQLMNQVKPLYEIRGLVRAAFPKIEVTRAVDVDGLSVVVHVVEGEPYTLADVKVVGAPQELADAGEFKRDEVANFGLIFEGVSKMRQALRGNGYMKVAAEVKRTYDDAKKQVTVFVHVTPGPQYRMGKFYFTGLDIVTEPYIRKLWGLQEGAPYRDGYPNRVIQRIHDEGLLDGVGQIEPKLEIDDQKLLVNVTIQFRGEPKPSQKKQRQP
jgi:outer membrane protein assembly factor BamA